MVRIRLRRVGARHQPSYRIIVADRESPRDGRFLENLGFYNPRTEPSTVYVDEARLFHWLTHGAQPSDAVVKILKPHGTWERWERYKGGEDLTTLLKETEGAFPEVDSRTRRDDLFQERAAEKKSKKKEEISPTTSDVGAEEEILEAEESAEPSAEEVTAEIAEGETLEQPAEEMSSEEPSEVEAESDEELDVQAVDEEAEAETSDDEEE